MSANANSGATHQPAPKRRRTDSDSHTVQHFADPTPHSPRAIELSIENMRAQLAQAEDDLRAARHSHQWRTTLASAPRDVGDGPNGHIAATVQSEMDLGQRHAEAVRAAYMPDGLRVLAELEFRWQDAEADGPDHFDVIHHHEIKHGEDGSGSGNSGWLDTEKLAMATQDKALQLRHLFAPASSCRRGKVVMLVAVSSTSTAQFAAAVVHMA